MKKLITLISTEGKTHEQISQEIQEQLEKHQKEQQKKQKEILDYLDNKIFIPILNNKDLDKKIISGARITKARMSALPVKSIVKYFWSAIVGTKKSLDFSDSLKKSGATRFEDILEDFRIRFDNNWLKNK